MKNQLVAIAPVCIKSVRVFSGGIKGKILFILEEKNLRERFNFISEDRTESYGDLAGGWEAEKGREGKEGRMVEEMRAEREGRETRNNNTWNISIAPPVCQALL